MRSQSGKWGHIFSFIKVSFMAFTSIEDHKRLDVACCQLREELMEQGGKSVVISPVLLVQKVVKVEAEVETAAVDDQVTVPEPHVLQDMSVLLHEGGQTLDSHEASESAETQHWVTGGTLPHWRAERNSGLLSCQMKLEGIRILVVANLTRAPLFNNTRQNTGENARC